MRVVRNNIILAESNNTVIIEKKHYFPPDSINWDYVEKSDKHTNCPWKGQASYLTIRIGDQVEKDAAWYYPDPMEAAKEIKDYVSFYKGIEASP
jgi:uncharacterized protein (DUF427 family)